MTEREEIKAGSALWVAAFVFIVMSGMAFNIIANDGFDHGVGNDNFNAGFSDPWQSFIHMDLMTGLVLMVAWMIFRERGGSINHKVAWALLFLWWGNIAVATYIGRAIARSGTNALPLFAGRRGGAANEVDTPGTLGKVICCASAIGAAAVLVNGLAAVGLKGVPAFGYMAGFGSLTYAFLIFAFVRNER